MNCDRGIRRLIMDLGDKNIIDKCNIFSKDTEKDAVGIDNSSNIVAFIGSWEDSDTTLYTYSDEFTWEYILTQYQKYGYKHVIFIGHSHGGKIFHDIVQNYKDNDNWKWDSLNVELFINVDGTGPFGAVDELGDRPKRILNFYQTGGSGNSNNDLLTEIIDFVISWTWFQNGSKIHDVKDKDNNEFDLTGCVSHVDMDSSKFVHRISTKRIQSVISEIRNMYRNGNSK